MKKVLYICELCKEKENCLHPCGVYSRAIVIKKKKLLKKVG